MSELKFIKLKIPHLILPELVENVKGKTFSTEQFYLYQDAQVKNPFNHLYALVDEEKKIHGFLWAETNLLDRSLFVNTFSIGKEHWGKGNAMDLVVKFLKELKKLTNAPKVYWLTTNVKFFEKKGFKRSKNVLLEYNEEEQ